MIYNLIEAMNKLIRQRVESEAEKFYGHNVVSSGDEAIYTEIDVKGNLRVLGILECQNAKVNGIIQIVGEFHVGVWGG